MLGFDPQLITMVGFVGGLLALATVVGILVERQLAASRGSSDMSARRARRVNRRIIGWWAVLLTTLVAAMGGQHVVVAVFGLLSFLAFREFVTLSPTGFGDHVSLVMAFYLMIPVQYILVGTGNAAAASIFIPVYCFLILALRSAMDGQTARFLERTATIQWGMMACVYCVSHVPLVMTVDAEFATSAGPVLLVVWVVIVVQAGDAFGNLADTFVDARTSQPTSSGVLTESVRTRWGLLTGMVSAAGIGAVLGFATPFTLAAAAGVGALLALAGAAGRVVLGAIKRDRGVRYYGEMVIGHGGVLDRVDSLMFAAPAFVHALPWIMSVGVLVR